MSGRTGKRGPGKPFTAGFNASQAGLASAAKRAGAGVPGAGRKPLRESGRHFTRRVLELPEAELPKVPMCGADRLARHAFDQALACRELDAVRALEILHRDAYGTSSTLHTPDLAQVPQTSGELDQQLEQLGRERARILEKLTGRRGKV